MLFKRPLICTILFIVVFTAGPAVPPASPLSNELARFERAKAHFKEGFAYFNNMQYLAAVEFFRKALADYPEYHTAREYLARSYRLAGFRMEAITEWEQLLNETSDNVLVQQKLDRLRYQETDPVYHARSRDFVVADEYMSRMFRHHRFSHPVDITLDSEKNVYITSFSSGKLVKISADGGRSTVLNAGIKSKLFGIDYHNRKLVLSDFARDRIYILNTKPHIIKTFGDTGNEEGKFHGPQGACFDEKGNIYVADSGNDRIQKFGPEGNFILSFGKSGEYEGELHRPGDCVVYQGNVYVSDSGNGRISSFDDSGNFIGNLEIKGLSSPRGINVHKGDLIIADEKKGLIFYNPADENTFRFDSWENNKRGFNKLFSALYDRDGMLYCLDYNTEKVHIFSPVQYRYTNLDVEISAIDLNKFPRVALYLSVRDQTGQPVYGLMRNNFNITEDSAGMTGIYVDYLKDKKVSASMVLCVDRSVSMSGYHNDIPWVSEFILKKMRKNDSLEVASFNNDYWIENKYDWSRRRALKALKHRRYGNGKNIGKALYNALSDCIPRINRRGVILLTDGKVAKDSFNMYTVRNIIDYARCHHVPIYIITLKHKHPDLKMICERTGGQIYSANELDGLRSIYDKIRNGEEYRYVIVYSTYKNATLKGWWSELKIEVKHRGLEGVEWGGYFVP